MRKRLLALAATSAATFGLMATGAMGTTTALANGTTGGTTCTNVSAGSIVVQCVGQINGNTVTIGIGEINVLSQDQLNVLNVDIDKVLNNDANISDIQLEVNKVAVDVVSVVVKDVNVLVCQVKVVELGVTNVNIAKCPNG
jgi:hypothetical protein